MQNASDDFFQAKIALNKSEQFRKNFTREHEAWLDIKKVVMIKKEVETSVMPANMMYFFREAICDNFCLLLDCALEKETHVVKELEEEAVFEYKTKMESK